MHIRWTEGANRNLSQIEKYIASENPNAAIDTVIKIIRTVELLTENTALGRYGRVTGTRELIIPPTPYIVPYRVRENCVEILRVLRGSMQWPKKL